MGRRKKVDNVIPIHNIHETDEEIALRIEERFLVLDLMTAAAINGSVRSLIVSGPPGVGKSYSIKRKLIEYDESRTMWDMVSGNSRATGLYKQLWRYRRSGAVLVLDDIDIIFSDEISLSLLKKACDTTEERTLSWLSEGNLFDEDSGENIPKTFDFNGSVIFITNLDFDYLIGKEHKYAPHLAALISRSHYLDLTMYSPKEYMIRINQVVNEGGMLDEYGEEIEEKTMNYLNANYLSLRELSLRMVIKIAQTFKEYPDIGELICNSTTLKQRR